MPRSRDTTGRNRSGYDRVDDPRRHDLPLDPDLPRREAARVRRTHRRAWRLVRERRDLLAVISAGGALGSLARWSLAEALPHDPGAFAWATFAANVTGALLLGLLMAFMADVLARTRYVRPFLGVGVLGGYTTFSTYTLDARTMAAAGAPVTALAYVALTLLAGLAAVWAGLVLGRAAVLVTTGAHRRHDRKDR